MRRIQMAVFDMAGTTVNEKNVVYKSLWKTLLAAGYDVSLEKVLEIGAGKEKLQAIEDLLTLLDPQLENLKERASELHAQFLQTLEEAYRQLDVCPFEGTTEVFQTLRDQQIKVVLNTGYGRATAEFLLEKLQWKIGDQIDLLVTADDVQNGRPAPDMILIAMEKWNMTSADQVLKVGDSIIDIEEGKNAGCGITVGVSTGAHTVAQLNQAQPDHIIDSLREIPKLVL
ncbi:MAG: phosphonatase-like hydrolase [Saprospiraceae bacterium]|nr:phosphonatase-like hydrolase [Saprospiraceae bacterium]